MTDLPTLLRDLATEVDRELRAVAEFEAAQKKLAWCEAELGQRRARSAELWTKLREQAPAIVSPRGDGGPLPPMEDPPVRFERRRELFAVPMPERERA